MLVLSRKVNERIHLDLGPLLAACLESGQVVDGEIVLTVVEHRGDKTRLGIEAPRLVGICRDDAKRKGSERGRAVA